MRQHTGKTAETMRVWRAMAMAILLLGSGLGSGVALGQGLVINEFMADNTETLTNKLGKTSDWVELYNGTGSATNLIGWHLTDDPLNLGKWTFPSTNVAAGRYLLVYASGSNGVYFGELHASFKLSKNAGGYLALVDSNLNLVSSYTNYPDQDSDVSYGIATNVPGGLGYFTRSSPGAANSNGLVAAVADTKFSVDSGLFTTNIQVAITTATAGAEIRYTTDCSVPATNSTLYGGPFTISSSTVIRAAAFKYGYIPTDVDTRVYIFIASVLSQPAAPAGFPTIWTNSTVNPGNLMKTDARYAMVPSVATAAQLTNAILSLPMLTITTAGSNLFDSAYGIYVNAGMEGDAWERPAAIEWVETNGTKVFRTGCGLRIQGNTTRGYDKHSFRVLFKDVYGPSKLDADVFPGTDSTKSFDTLIFRAGSIGDLHTYIYDECPRRTQIAMGQPGAHGRYANLFVNGLYWGLYNVVEKPDQAFAETYYGGDKDNWDVIQNGETNNGDLVAWTEFMTLNLSRPGDNALYQQVQGNNSDGTRNPAYQHYIDMDSYIDYMLVEQWYNNQDWAHWNWNAMRYRDNAASTGFKFPVWDAEMWGAAIPNPLEKADPNVFFVRWGIAKTHRALLTSTEYRLHFADHVYRHCFNGGALTTNQVLPLFTNLAASVRMAVLAEAARWPTVSKVSTNTTTEAWWDVIVQRMGVLAARPAAILSVYRSNGLYPGIDPPVFNQWGGAFASGFQLTMTSAHSVYYTLDGTDPREYGTGNAIGTLYTGGMPLPYSVRVKARARSTGGEWSALNEAVFVKSGASQVRVTEVMYHPRQPVGTETNAAWTQDDFEFVEVQNAGEETVGLAGMRFTDGGTFYFDEGSLRRLLPGEYAVVVKNRDAFTNRYAALMPMNIAGEFRQVDQFPQGGLSDNGETVTLKDGTNGIVAQFTYGDGRDWPAAADGAGHSLVPRPVLLVDQTNGAADYGGNWRASAYRDGSPGRADPDPVADVVINEVMAHTDYSGGALWQDSNDWIEFYNTKSNAVSFTTNWFLSDDPEDLKKWRIPGTNVVAATNWITFFEVGGFHPATNSGFGLNKAGDAVYLSYLAGGTNDRVVDCVPFKGQANFRTWGRYPDGAARWYTTLPTTNKANALATNTVVINEIMYHPPTNANYALDNGDVEYVELYNAGATTVTLTNEGGACRLAGGVDYKFATTNTMAAGSYLVLVSFDPSTNSAARASFLAYYGLTNGQVRLMGPYSGRLSDGGDRVAVEFPLLGDLPGDDISWVIMDEVYYSDRMPWPENADGAGASLSRLQSSGSGNESANWLGRTPTPGSNNTVSAATPVPVVSVTSLSVPEGGTNMFRVRLSASGAATVTVSRVSGDTNLTVQSGASLVFSTGNWNTDQAVTLAASSDTNAADGVATFACTITNRVSVTVAATEADRDVWLTLLAGSGGTVSPADPVSVIRNGSNDIQAIAASGYGFTNWTVVSGGGALSNAYAAATKVTLSAPVTILANFLPDMPACSIANPADMAVVKAGSNVTIQATASSGFRSISRVEFLVGGTEISEDATAPYSCVWSNVSAGAYQLTARAIDSAGKAGTSAVVSVFVAASEATTLVISGGTVTNYLLDGAWYRAHIFNTVGPTNLLVTAGGGVEVLVVGGGGGGGGGSIFDDVGGCGGGGAGGVIITETNISAGGISIVVGGGGALGVVSAGSNGSASSFGVLIAGGGGGGGALNGSGVAGGIGMTVGGCGGGAGRDAGAGGARGATSGNGVITFNSAGGDSGGLSWGSAGGGGGAGGAGYRGGTDNVELASSAYGRGGPGTNCNFSGSNQWYAGGGGGSWQTGWTQPQGGIGGGGNAGRSNQGGHGAAGTGGGGGAGLNAMGGSGGSGIVIVRYLLDQGTTYTVLYDANGATGGTAPASQIKTQNVAVVVSANTGNLVKTSHTFAGWNTTAGGSGTDYAAGANYTANAHVTLYAKWVSNAPPTITAQPVNALVAEGQTATFSVTATGSPTLVYQWFTNNTVIGGATGASYITAPTALSDSGTVFKVTVSNAYGSATSSNATLRVAPYVPVSATGGTITNYTLNGTNFTAHIFTNDGTFAVNSGGNVEILIVGGGGGGARSGASGSGGGGAGGFVLSNAYPVATGSYAVVVGAGGAGRAGTSGAGTTGGNSAFGAVTALGGGYGGYSGPGGSGGSGGGGAGSAVGGSGTVGQGNVGGDGFIAGTSGGGGGAGAAGGNATAGTGGNGGAGASCDFSGVAACYAGGGGGGAVTPGTAVHGGGHGANGTAGTNGVAGTGGGGGGAIGDKDGGNGGSGIVIVRYVTGGGASATSTYTVAYSGNGATSGNAPASQIKTQNVAVVVSGNTGNLAKTSHTFAGWNTATNGGGTDYGVGASYTANADVTLYAKWVTNAPPTITVPPSSTSVMVGATATFSVIASGTPTLVYQWFTNNAAISGATGTSYTTAATTTNESGRQFKVTVSNAYGVVTSSVATLTVNAAPAGGGVVASGGTITNYTLGGTNWTAHIFTNGGLFTVTSSGAVEYLIVGGGGGGGRDSWGAANPTQLRGSGGGGAGGLLTGATSLAAQAYAITVGAGGAGATDQLGATGSNSIAFGLTAYGGGGGGAIDGPPGLPGGSGGGGGHNTAGGLATPAGQGNDGGTGNNLNPWHGSGGGGAGTAGQTGGNGPGGGGTGVVSAISGVSTYYAGGGGGGGGASGDDVGKSGGLGGGGAGGGDVTSAGNGTDGLGGGGGGGGVAPASLTGGKGGSGIVIVRYVTGGGVDPFEAWRQTYFTADQLTNTAVSGATVDADGDGLNNEQEYWAGTDPTNRVSSLVLYASTNAPIADGKFVVRWQSVSNRRYAVMAATNLVVGFTNLMTNIVATPNMNVYTDNVQSAAHRFYRVRVE